ncbi:DUF4124 domain-containing protein [Desulfosarcina sp. OttesenSCG-928-B08]|nr:DUF4124 domain-containing protein [Desulfosarcina sp. OttesenSCG-928-B08]
MKKMTFSALIVMMALMVGAPLAHAQVYQYTDESGKKRWTDDPNQVPENRKDTIITVDPGDPESETDSAPPRSSDTEAADSAASGSFDVDTQETDVDTDTTDTAEAAALEAEKKALDQMHRELETERKAIDAAKAGAVSDRAALNERIKAYNEKTEVYETRSAKFNEKVSAYNKKIMSGSSDEQENPENLP